MASAKRNWRCRFIPTGVGNGFIANHFEQIRAVHPHGCGERKRWHHDRNVCRGSSPRVWGTGALAPDVPAVRAVHPHGCGERLCFFKPANINTGSSPRVWGTDATPQTGGVVLRFIPTGVGNGMDDRSSHAPAAVHPHGCGERTNLFYNLVNQPRFIPTGVGNGRH